MKDFRMLFAILAGSLFTVSFAFANPGMLPSHPGYPAGGKSPVTGQRTANDAGQTNASFLTQSATSHDSASMNDVSDPNRQRIKKSAGAGRLPEVDGALNRVQENPTGAKATKMN